MKKISLSDALKIVIKRINAGDVYGMLNKLDESRFVDDGGAKTDYLIVLFEPSRGVSANLSVDFGALRAGQDTYNPVVRVKWSSVNLDVDTALAAITLYREVIKLASDIQAMLNEYSIEV